MATREARGPTIGAILLRHSSSNVRTLPGSIRVGGISLSSLQVPVGLSSVKTFHLRLGIEGATWYSAPVSSSYSSSVRVFSMSMSKAEDLATVPSLSLLSSHPGLTPMDSEAWKRRDCDRGNCLPHPSAKQVPHSGSLQLGRSRDVLYNDSVGSRTGRPLLRFRTQERKVRTPQSSVPDNVREAGFKPVRRKVPQKTYRPGGNAEVRVKRCGKSAPPPQ